MTSRPTPTSRDITYVDQDETYEEFKRIFEGQTELIETVSPEVLPPSFRVAPETKDPEVVKALGETFKDKPGVYEVVFAFEVVKPIQETFNKIGVRFLLAAGLLLLAAGLLILNTIRVAMFARRREIEVMKLVGATNWFIRVPFIVEGIIQTLIGAAVAVASMTFVIRPFIDELSQEKLRAPLPGLRGHRQQPLDGQPLRGRRGRPDRRHRLGRGGQPLPRRLARGVSRSSAKPVAEPLLMPLAGAASPSAVMATTHTIGDEHEQQGVLDERRRPGRRRDREGRSSARCGAGV